MDSRCLRYGPAISFGCAPCLTDFPQINPDGHCLFSALADQLALLHVIPPKQATYAQTRAAAAAYMLAHPDSFLPFLPSEGGEDGVGSTSDTGMMTPVAFERYCATMRDTGAWGGEPEIMALCSAYDITINVVQGGTPNIVPHTPLDSPSGGGKVAWISYHRRMYGLGEVRAFSLSASLILNYDSALQLVTTKADIFRDDEVGLRNRNTATIIRYDAMNVRSKLYFIPESTYDLHCINTQCNPQNIYTCYFHPTVIDIDTAESSVACKKIIDIYATYMKHRRSRWTSHFCSVLWYACST